MPGATNQRASGGYLQSLLSAVCCSRSSLMEWHLHGKIAILLVCGLALNPPFVGAVHFGDARPDIMQPSAWYPAGWLGQCAVTADAQEEPPAIQADFHNYIFCLGVPEGIGDRLARNSA